METRQSPHEPSFGGETYDPEQDGERLYRQIGRVRRLFERNPGKWFTLRELSNFVGAPEASVSARLRDLRKNKFGGFEIEAARIQHGSGTWRYRMPRS